MPTIQQLPPAIQVDPADEIPVSQAGATHAMTAGMLLSGTQAAILAPTGMLLGRASLGPGGPEPIVVGTGLTLRSGCLAANGADHASYPTETSPSSSDQIVIESGGAPKLLPLPSLQAWLGGGGGGGAVSLTSLPLATALGSGDLVAINQNGTNAAISYANLLDAETIDQAGPALSANDTDALWVSQGSSVLLRQTFAGIWNWFAAKLPNYKRPVVELSTDTVLDGTVHNGRILVCSHPLTLTPLFLNMGSGFFCDVLNLSAGNVVFAPGILTSTGQSILSPSQAALLRGVAYSGGNIVFAAIPSAASGTPISTPGQITGLSATAPTSSGVTLSWSLPGSGGPPSSYTVLFVVSGGSNWATFSSGITGTSVQVTGLSAATSYTFEVVANNAAGSGPASAPVTLSTTTGSVAAITWNVGPASSYTAGGGTFGVNVHVSPATAPVEFGVSTSTTVSPTTWIAGANVNSDLWGAYIPVPSIAGTYYVWCQGTDGSAATVYPNSFLVS